MKCKTILCFLALAASAPTCRARLTAEDALLSAPGDVIAPLDSRTLRDLIEYCKAGMAGHTEPNMFDGEGSVESLAADRALFSPGYGKKVEIRLLPAAKDTVYAVTETFSTPIADSRLTLYNRDWKPLKGKWREPQLDEWLSDEGRRQKREAGQLIPFILAEYTIDNNGILTLTGHTAERMDRETRPAAERLLKPELKYKWHPSKGFKPVTKK